MKRLSLVWGYLLAAMVLVVAQYPVHYPKEFLSYWPILATSIPFIALVVTILVLIKRKFYKGEKMPSGEIWIGVLFIVVGIVLFTFEFLHSPCLH